jgi:hypothetical protein
MDKMEISPRSNRVYQLQLGDNLINNQRRCQIHVPHILTLHGYMLCAVCYSCVLAIDFEYMHHTSCVKHQLIQLF